MEDKYLNFIYALVFGYAGGHNLRSEKMKKKHLWKYKPGVLFFADYIIDIVKDVEVNSVYF